MKNLGIALLLCTAFAVRIRSQPNVSAGIGNKIVYVEYQATDPAATKAFFERTFAWNFAEQSPTCLTFFDGRMSGSFTKSDKCGKRGTGAALISIYSENLEETRRKVTANGGKVVQDIVADVGGRHFVFEEPSGNEFAVVSSK